MPTTALQSVLTFAHHHGGPYKLLLLQLRGGQLIGALLAMSIYAWLLSLLTTHAAPSPPSNAAVAAIGSLLSAYILALLPGTWIFFERGWFGWVCVCGDGVAIAGAVAVAVLTRGGAAGGTLDCSGPFYDGGAKLGGGDVQQACKLQKVVFATGVTNSLMFFVTLALGLFLKSRWYSAPQVGKVTEKVEAAEQV